MRSLVGSHPLVGSCNWNMSVRRLDYFGGGTYYNKWAGGDRPETIVRLYEESTKWLEEE